MRSGGQGFTDELKVAILLASLKPEIKVHLLMRIKDSTKYSKARGILVDYLRAQQSWTPSTGPMPMEVDALSLGQRSLALAITAGKLVTKLRTAGSRAKARVRTPRRAPRARSRAS